MPPIKMYQFFCPTFKYLFINLFKEGVNKTFIAQIELGIIVIAHHNFLQSCKYSLLPGEGGVSGVSRMDKRGGTNADGGYCSVGGSVVRSEGGAVRNGGDYGLSDRRPAEGVRGGNRWS